MSDLLNEAYKNIDELQAHVIEWMAVAGNQRDRADAAEARVAELTPPEGYVDVRLPREDVDFLAACARYKREDTPRFRMYEACRKALEADDA